MRCERMLSQISAFLDGMLGDSQIAGVTRHLRTCPECSREVERTRQLRQVLSGLPREQPPEYLHHLVRLKIGQESRNTLWGNLRSFCEFRWSRIRSTEGIWYLTRLTGTMATIVLFMAISSAINPFYLEFGAPLPLPPAMSQAVRYTAPAAKFVDSLQNRLLSNLGMTPREAQRPTSSSEPKINPLYLVNLGQSTSRTAQNDTVSVVFLVDRSGAATVQNVLEYPADESLLNETTDMITSADWRPASQNGRAVDSRMVFTFSKVYVFN